MYLRYQESEKIIVKKDHCNFIYKSVHAAKQILMAELELWGTTAHLVCERKETPMYLEAYTKLKLATYGPLTVMVYRNTHTFMNTLSPKAGKHK